VDDELPNPRHDVKEPRHRDARAEVRGDVRHLRGLWYRRRRSTPRNGLGGSEVGAADENP
jgi:hypothetical protein